MHVDVLQTDIYEICQYLNVVFSIFSRGDSPFFVDAAM